MSTFYELRGNFFSLYSNTIPTTSQCTDPHSIHFIISICIAWKKKIGTMNYCAPETFEGKPSSTKSDIYAVGILLWEMLFRTITGNSHLKISCIKISTAHIDCWIFIYIWTLLKIKVNTNDRMLNILNSFNQFKSYCKLRKRVCVQRYPIAKMFRNSFWSF